MTDLETLARDADWQQVVMNGGPPCFFVEEDGRRFCLRAERWGGHTDKDEYPEHRFVSLAALLATVRKQAHAQERHTRYLKSCPWCGEPTKGKPVSHQINHLIDCGDRRIAEERRDERALRIVEEERGRTLCNCNAGYTIRNLTDPHCGRCNDVDDTCDEIKRRLKESDGERKPRPKRPKRCWIVWRRSGRRQYSSTERASVDTLLMAGQAMDLRWQ